MALQRPHPALGADHHGDGLVDHADLGHRLLLFLDQRAPRVAVGLGVGLDLAHQHALQRRRAAQYFFELALLFAQFLQLLLDLHGFQPRQLAQSDFQDVLGLPVTQVEARDQRRLGLVGAADDADHLVDVQQHDLPAFQHVDAFQHLGQAVARAAVHGGLPEGQPLGQHAPQALLHRAAVQAHHGQVHRQAAFQAGVGQQRGDQVLLLHGAALGLEDQAHRGVLVALIAHGVQHGQDRGFQLDLLWRQRLLAGLDLGVGQLVDLFQDLLRTGAGRQFGDNQLPLPARQVFDDPTGPHLDAAAPVGIGRADVGGRADDLAAAGEIGRGQQGVELVVRQRFVLQQGDGGGRHFTQVVAGDFGGQADGDAAGAVQEDERKSRGQLAGFFGAAVVVRLEVDRALVDLVQHQPRDGAQPRFGVAHGRRAVAVAAAEVALAVDQRVALRKALRHAHQGVVGGGVTVRVVAAQHIAHHAGALDRLGAAGRGEGQAHAVHGVEDAALHRLVAVADIGQGAALDDRQRVLQVSALGVVGQGQRFSGVTRRRGRGREQVGHAASGSANPRGTRAAANCRSSPDGGSCIRYRVGRVNDRATPTLHPLQPGTAMKTSLRTTATFSGLAALAALTGCSS